MSKTLILDDDDDFRESLAEWLVAHGHTVVQDSNGARVLEHLHDHEIDLVITDVVMPRKDGIETLQEIRRNSPGTRVIVISGGGRVGAASIYLTAAEALSADAVLRKPIAPERLLETLKRVQAEGERHPPPS